MAGRKQKGSAARPTAREQQTPKSPAPSTESPMVGEAMPASMAWSLTGSVAVAVACLGLAIFQWMELLLIEAGQAAVCTLDEVFNCSAIWEAPLAKWWQATTRVPVAGWGLIWAALALVQSLWTVAVRLQQRDAERPVAGARLVAAAGVATAVLLGGYSLALGQICLTCWTTYLLVGVYAALVWRWRPAPSWPAYRSALGPVIVGLVVGYGLAWGPGTATPLPGAALDFGASNGNYRPSSKTKIADPTAAEASEDLGSGPSSPVAEYIESLPVGAQRQIAAGLAEYRTAAQPDVPARSARPYVGREDAPVRIVDFSDLRCPHCARLAGAMAQLIEQLPATALQLESRYFPLDAECNGRLDPKFTDGTHLRCVAAKALLCSQSSPYYEALRQQMFREQTTLSVSRVHALVQDITGVASEELSKCLEAASTKAKLDEDIDYASRFDITGTPMVVLNGRRVMAYPPLIMALILARGDPNHPGFNTMKRP